MLPCFFFPAFAFLHFLTFLISFCFLSSLTSLSSQSSFVLSLFFVFLSFPFLPSFSFPVVSLSFFFTLFFFLSFFLPKQLFRSFNFFHHTFLFQGKCQLPLGLENKEVPNPRMHASSYRYASCGPYNGRLNQPYAWCSKYRRQREWLAIDFGAMTKMTGIATQGRRNANEWVKSYYLSSSRKGVHWTPYKERRKTKVGFRNIYKTWTDGQRDGRIGG